MINLQKYILIVLCLSLGIIAQAQNDVKLSNFIFTPLVHNPAYAGSSDGYSITGFYTSQWVGFEGAPQTLILTGHDRIGLTNLGAGFDIISDNIGVTKQNRITGNTAYHFRLTDEWLVSAGIKFGINNYSVDYRLLSIENPSEFGNPLTEVSKTSFIVGTGVFFHRENFFIGLSVPNFLTTNYIDDFRNPQANSTPNYFLSSGYKFDLKRDIYLQPTLLTRVAKGAPYSALVAFNLDWKDKMFLNLNYEYNVSVGAFFGVRITDRIMAGFAYDTATTTFAQENGSIYSFMINFRPEERQRKDRCGCYTY